MAFLCFCKNCYQPLGTKIHNHCLTLKISSNYESNFCIVVKKLQQNYHSSFVKFASKTAELFPQNVKHLFVWSNPKGKDYFYIASNCHSKIGLSVPNISFLFILFLFRLTKNSVQKTNLPSNMRILWVNISLIWKQGM